MDYELAPTFEKIRRKRDVPAPLGAANSCYYKKPYSSYRSAHRDARHFGCTVQMPRLLQETKERRMAQRESVKKWLDGYNMGRQCVGLLGKVLTQEQMRFLVATQIRCDCHGYPNHMDIASMMWE